MANVKISQLPSTTASTVNDWLVKNDSGETTTSKIQLKNVMGLTPGSADNSLQSSKYITALGTTASTIGSIAIGAGAEATSPYAIAVGYNAINFNRDGFRDYYIAFGYDAQSITEGVAFGKSARCLATAGFAIGNNTQVFGNGGFALGNSAQSYGNDGIAIGTNSRDNTGLLGQNNGIAIGGSARVDREQAVSIGYGVQDLYSATTHVQAIHTYKQETFSVISAGNVGGNINVDCSLGTIFTFVMTANTTPNFVNLRPGQRFIFIVNNAGSFTVPTATVNGSSNTVYAKGGSLNPTNNGYTKYQAVYVDNILWLDEQLNFQAV